MNLKDMYYHYKNIQYVLGEKKYHDLKNSHFEKNDLKDQNKTFLYFMTIFHNFALNIETS